MSNSKINLEVEISEETYLRLQHYICGFPDEALTSDVQNSVIEEAIRSFLARSAVQS